MSRFINKYYRQQPVQVLDRAGERFGAPGVPNPYATHLHNWIGGPLNEGNSFHGPNYTEPMFQLPRRENPIWGPSSESGLSGVNMSMRFGQDVATRNGSFANRGYGGGIFNLNAGLGADGNSLVIPSLPGGLATGTAIWGQYDPSFMGVQKKLNDVLYVNGKPMIPLDGILSETFCQGGRNLIGLPGDPFTKFLNTLSQTENGMVTAAILQCNLKGLAFPCSLPEVVNAPGCQSGGVTPPAPTPGPTPTPTTCPSGSVLVNGVCIPSGVTPPNPQPPAPTTCPSGSVNIGGLCIPSGVIPSQPKPGTACPAGSVNIGGVCIPNGVVPPSVVPPLQCPAGQQPSPDGKSCVPAPAPATATNYVPYVVGGLVIVGLGIVAWQMSKKKR